jgi:hypothetical protein
MTNFHLAREIGRNLLLAALNSSRSAGEDSAEYRSWEPTGPAIATAVDALPDGGMTSLRQHSRSQDVVWTL